MSMQLYGFMFQPFEIITFKDKIAMDIHISNMTVKTIFSDKNMNFRVLLLFLCKMSASFSVQNTENLYYLPALAKSTDV